MKIIHQFKTAWFLGILFFSQSLYASFHLWDISEIYSNEDGSVQFIELVTSSGGQGFLRRHVITSTSSDGQVNSFEFPSDLSGNTANKTMLLATPGFVQIEGAVQADYTIPAGFLFPAGTVNFADSDSLTYTALPTDGVNSLNDALVSGTNSPVNFNAQGGSLDGTLYAILDLTTATMNLPLVDAGSLGVFNVTMLFDFASSQFTVAGLEKLENPNITDRNGLISYDAATGVLNIPFGFIVDFPTLFSVQLQLLPTADGNLTFSVLSLTELSN